MRLGGEPPRGHRSQGRCGRTRMREYFTYGSVGGAGGNPGPYPAANRRPAFPLNVGWQFGSASCAPPSLSAAVAHAGLGKKIELHMERLPWYVAAMSIEQIAAEALRLPPKERAMLAESLWESLVDPFEVPASADDSEAVALAIERDRQLEGGEVQPISHEEMMARLRR
jgi:hypothetical protein